MAGERAGAASLTEAVAIMRRLRGEGGCPWDREQSFDSIRRYTLEETYEVLDAIDRRDWPGLKDELGDLLLQVLFYAQMAEEAGHFNIADVIENLNAKLVRRHPHVFGDTDAANADAVLRNWEAIKRQEREAKAGTGGGEGKDGGLLEAVPRNMPALLEAEKLGSKAAKVGFDWPDAEGVFAKLEEEVAELREAMAEGTAERVTEEAGDLLFTAANLLRKVQVDGEMALRGANAKFRRRFAAMEQAAAEQQAGLADLSADELERLWSEAKGGRAIR